MFQGLKSIRRQAGPSQASKGILPFYLALGYLIWGIFPHAAFRVHEHAGGSAAHTHRTFHDAGLRVEALVTANPPESAQEASESSGSAEANDAGAGTGTLSFKPEDPRHGHFTEDDNILAAGISVARTLLPVPHPASAPAPVLSPSLPYSGPATARGPPSRA